MKKKNLLKCLALTSMLALSVGAVTSCGTQGEAGKDGAQGAQGVQGAQGEKGDKGDKGDTTYEVIILQSEVSGGKVTSSAYTGIKGDSPVLTFSPATEGEVVISLTINYEEVALTDEILGGSLKLTFSDQSFIVTAKFGTAQSYGENLISDYYNSLAKQDNQMDYLVSGNGTARQGSTESAATYVKDFVKGSYYDSTVASVAHTYYGKVATTLAAMKKTATTKEKIEAVKKVYEEAKTKIDEKYKKVIDAAVVKGGKNIDTLYSSGSSVKNMSSTDIAAMIKSAKADLSAAKTLQGISKVIDSVVSKSPVLAGDYNEIERLRTLGFASIKSAIESVYTADPSMDPGSTTASAEKYAAFIAQLASFGISEDALPTKVYENYKAQLSAATSFSYYVKDDTTNYSSTTLAVEAVKAISDASKNVISVVRQAVLDSYYKEIDSSTALTTDQAKVTCKGAVETTISAWFDAHSSDKLGSVTNFLSYSDTTPATPASMVGGGLYNIEKVLARDYVAFNAERLTKKKTEVAAAISAKAKEYIDADTLYKNIISATIGADKEFADKAAVATEYGVQEQSVTDLRTLVVNTVAGTYDLQQYVNCIVTNKSGTVLTTGNDGGYIKDNMGTVIELLTYKDTILGNLKTIKDNAVDKFIVDEKASLGTATVHDTYGTYAVSATGTDLSEKYTALFDDKDNCTTVHEKLLASNSSNWVGLVDSLGSQYHTWWYTMQTYVTGDAEGTYAKATVSEVWKTIQSAVTSIIKGEITTYDQVKDVINGLSAKYGVTVENYYQQQLKNLTSDRDTTLYGMSDGGLKEVENKRYDNWVAIANTGSFTFGSYGDVDTWYNLASTEIKAAPTALTDAVDLASKCDTARTTALSLIAGYLDEVKIGGKLLTEDEKGYDDVLAVIDVAYEAVATAGSNVANIEAVIKDTAGVLSGSLVDGLTSDVVTLGAARSAGYANLEAAYKADIAAVTGSDAAANGKKAAIKAQYNVEVGKVAVAANATAITDLIKNASGVYSGTSVTAMSAEETYKVSYKASALAESKAYLRKAVVENPGKNSKLFSATDTELTYAEKTDVGDIYTELARYEAHIDAIIAAE